MLTQRSRDFVEYDFVASARPRKCPRCSVTHYWPTEDKLCYVCEGEWVDDYEYVLGIR